ncbi:MULTISPECIES: rhomboid family intramembrane serine protease [unclassified Kitasatospora]|uniref:rhomboid family intramembrane serine protease n=1 Tax=unclassified Kitasatospora TaxID=2633591 RepID=UPI0007089472|nr:MULTISPECIES: rhomboid family intramembrane serine protease [unclassified Kitasatospora]KQV15391.1 peptidase S54 family protein [Kitasatospora sp. Root107]KRB64020.1 peptidase S54 family protein [Kitasatospora sp. Root187]
MPADNTPSSIPDPARMVADARRAFFVMFGLLCLVWAVQLANWLTDYRLTVEGGILARRPDQLADLLTAPFLHVNWQHLEGNSGPLFVFGFLAAYRGIKRFLGLTALLVLTSGAAVWLFSDDRSVTVGASGVIYGYFGYVVLRGLIDRNLIDSLIGVVMGASFAYILTTAVPGTPGVSWQGHLGGLVGGLAGAWIFRARKGSDPAPAPAPTSVPGQAEAPPSERAQLLKELDDLGL